tara:strand:+ start:762 stop:1238 length:477 start_codon:yes stop_codon:yes gene_type:complete
MIRILFVIFLILSDQISKVFVVKNFSIGESLNILPIFDIFLILNTGIAFSLFDDGGSIGRWILVLLVFLVCLYLLYILAIENLNQYESLSLLMILSGGIGNLLDRAFRGHVIDFIHIYYESYSFYIFNLADTFITIGVMIYIYNLVISNLSKNGNKAS